MSKKFFVMPALTLSLVLLTAPLAQAATLLSYGSSGSAVKTIQTELTELGYNTGPEDGIFGSDTLSAVKSFQAADKLQVDGIVGPLTGQALSSASSEASQSVTPKTQSTGNTSQAQASDLLSYGSNGIAVKTLQAELTQLGYYSGPEDGIFGSETLAAVKSFQTSNGLQVDGVVGPLTNQALSSALRSSSNTAPRPTNNSSLTQRIISTAKSLTGVPYLWGGTTPSGFDCSGYTQYVFKANGITLPRTSLDQFQTGTPVAFNNLQPGDLVFFSFLANGQVSHVGIYLGNNQFISATTDLGVATYSFSPYWKNAYVGAREVY